MVTKQFDRGRIEHLGAGLDAQFGTLAGFGRDPNAGVGAFASPIEFVRAPGMVNLMGDHTDYNDGFVLPAAIELETWIAFRRRTDGRVRIASRTSSGAGSFWIDDLDLTGEPRGPESVRDREARFGGGIASGRAGGATAPGRAGGATAPAWSDYVAATAWSLREAALPIRGFDGFVDSTIPAGSGFSWSAPLELAAAIALLGGESLSSPALAALAQRGERDYLGINCGIVDQFVGAAGREERAIMLDCRSLDARYVPLPFGIRLVICETGDGDGPRFATGRGAATAGVATADRGNSTYETRRAECARAVALLSERMPGLSSMRDLDAGSLRRHRGRLPENVARRAEHVVSENARVVATAAALEAGDLDELGRLFAESHASLRDSYEVSSPALDAMVEVASAIPGVVASRMTGPGPGGCIVNLVLADAVPALQAAVDREYTRRTGLNGHIYPVAVVDGAGRLNPAAG
jgi:galactokinase